MKVQKSTDMIIYAAIAILLFGSGYKLGQQKASPFKQSITQKNANADKNVNFDLFWETWETVRSRYIDQNKIDTQKMVYGAIKGMVATLEDPYTFFLTPEENQSTKDDLGGKFEGIGAQLGLKNNRIAVIAPLKNSPAEAAGVQSGDFVAKVDGASTKGWTLPQAVSKIRGKENTQVKLTLERQQKEFDIPITRKQIFVPAIEMTYEKSGQVAYVKLNQFGDSANAEWNKAVEEIAEKWRNKEIRGMVLDLRDNPGGYLESAVYIAYDFIPEGNMIVKQESTVTPTRNYTVQRDGRLLDIPLTVLINEGSASASEILAGAIRDYERGTLVGAKSFGKGSVQEALDLKDGAGLHVTIAKWILPKGEWINGKGIEPDVKITNEVEEGNTLTNENDKQLQKALELIR